MSPLDVYFPPAREFRWAILDTPPRLEYPVKPYKRAYHRAVLDSNGDFFRYTVTSGRISQWSYQFNTFIETGPQIFWPTLTYRQRVRLAKKVESRKLRAYKNNLLRQRKTLIKSGHY